MKITNRQDFAAGVMYAAFGLATTAGALTYRMGTAVEMGPGYFPFWLGLLLVAVGIGVAVSALKRPDEIAHPEPWHLRRTGLILGSALLFGFILTTAGLALSVFAIVLLSSLASEEFAWRTSLLNALILSVLNVVIFVYVLRLQISVWPSALGG
jgi:hypothetical protein